MTDHGHAGLLTHRDAGVRGYGAKLKLTNSQSLDEAEVKELASKLMAQTASACLAEGAKFIGHIKCLIKTDAGNIKADILGRPESLFVAGGLNGPVTRLDLTINCIVQGLGEDELASITMTALEKAAGGRGYEMEWFEGKSYDPLTPNESHAHNHEHHEGHCQHGHQHQHDGHAEHSCVPMKTSNSGGHEEA